jgi:glycosyltransferase involved in cell wall biosynthesis
VTRKRILFVHQNFPAQFPHIAAALVARGDKVVAIGGPTARSWAGVELRRWTNNRSSTRGIFDAATRAEADLIRAAAAAVAAVALRDEGFEPDIIIGHPGWGETIHLKEVFPRARLILFGEFYYQSIGGDLNFDLEFETPTLESAMRTTAKNATQALALGAADRIVSPTSYQASTFPEIFRSRMTVLHEGLDLDRAYRRPSARLDLPDGRIVDSNTPVITFISRTLERLRGFHIFMRALPALQAAVPDAQVVVIGGDEGGYGAPLPGGEPWKDHMLAELGDRLDRSRVHFLGRVPIDRMFDALSVSSAHVYYTYPFTLSWSLVEAMACECLILGSDTAPVRDAVTNGVDGILNDFFDVAALSDAMIAAVRQPEKFADLRRSARRTAFDRFDRRTIGVPGWLGLIDQLA